jgi:hypothetical protein
MNGSFVTLAAYSDAHAANLALSCLMAAGVSAFLTGELTASTFSGNAGLGPHIQLLVARADSKRAADVLSGLAAELAMPAGWEDDFPAEDGYWICPQCDEAVEEVEEVCPWCKSRRPGGTTVQNV